MLATGYLSALQTVAKLELPTNNAKPDSDAANLNEAARDRQEDN